ncbi:MAG: amidase [Gemmatimonadota bacterium]
MLAVAWALAMSGAAATPAGAHAQHIDIVELTVDDVQAAYASGRLTAVELTQAFLDRIAQYEERYNAFISMNPDALRIAAELDAEYQAFGPRSPLHGVPIVIKDNIDYAGLVTTAGWEGFSAAAGGIDMVPGDNATVVSRLRKAGAIILGKTNLPDFAANGTRTRSTVAGRTLNSYHTDRAPGGSSGGTATAVSASFAVLGIGTETGGSIQNPASAQALVGVKPTFGLVPLDGVFPLDATYLDVVGPLARTVRDAAVALDVLADTSVYAAAIGSLPLPGKRFGLVGPGWRVDRMPLDTATERLYRDAVSTVVALGAEVVRDPFRGTEFARLYGRRPSMPSQRDEDRLTYLQRLGSAAAFRSVEEWEERTGRRFGPSRDDDANGSRQSRARDTTRGTADPALYEAWRGELRALFHRVLTEHRLDGLLFPQASAPAPPLVADPARPEYEPNDWPEIPSNIVNDLGAPVVTIPYAYYQDGTPFVLALIGDMWGEAALLAYAHEIESLTRARRAPVLY